MHICGTVSKINWDCVAANKGHSSSSNQPSEVQMETGVELSVGLSMALLTLVFFLHSNATWSLHNLWQFIPQSAKGQKQAQWVRTRTGGKSWDWQTSFYWIFFENTFCSANAVLRALCAYCKANKRFSYLFKGWGRGGSVVLTAAWFFFFFFCCKV